MKSILFAFATLLCGTANAQVNSASLQASGLTCSMCSNSISKALKTIPYVDDIKANISTSSFEIRFKPNSPVSFDQLKKKVEDAGFHVAKLTANITFDDTRVGDDKHVSVSGMNFHFLSSGDRVVDGQKDVQILDKGFVTSKEFKKGTAFTKSDCYRTGMSSACCSMNGISAGERVYHVSLR